MVPAASALPLFVLLKPLVMNMNKAPLGIALMYTAAVLHRASKLPSSHVYIYVLILRGSIVRST